METLPLETRTLYAELLDRLRARRAARGIKNLPGSFVEKTVKGRPYVYFQHYEPGGSARQTYIGPRNERLRGLLERRRSDRPDARREAAEDERLTAQLRAGGATSPDGPTARVLTAFADAGIFAAAAVLIGTQAFTALGTLLGRRWDPASGRTRDIDLAAVEIALPDAGPTDLPDALSRLEMGFLPVPALAPRSHSTSFMVRGGALRVDLVTPQTGRPSETPVYIPALKAHAAPLRFLDYLLAEPIEAALPTGAGLLVRVPQAARFAVHKLLVAAERPEAERAKAAKDLRQAAELAATLDEEGLRGDLRLAVADLKRRGPGWRKRLNSGAARLAKTEPGTKGLFQP